MGVIDQPKDIRKGEELPLKQVETFLKDSIPGLDGDILVHQFPSGFSNLTYLVTVGDRELVLRRPPFGTKAKTAHDMAREYNMLKCLKPVFPYCPKPLVYSEEPSIMECPFYVMERIRGIILRENLPEGLTLTPLQATGLCENLMDVLVKLHSIDYKAIGLGDTGKPEGYVRRQVEGWSKRFRNAWTDDAPDCEKIMQWLHDHMPQDTDNPCVIHNDYKFDNVVLDPKDPLRIIGVLDWEMATIGDPLMDLGGGLAYWVDKTDPDGLQMMRRLPTNMEGMLTRDEVVKHYAKLTGQNIDCFDFYFCFGLFRLAVIAQQIYYRYFHGQTKDDRFKMLVFGVKILEEAALGVIEKSDL